MVANEVVVVAVSGIGEEEQNGMDGMAIASKGTSGSSGAAHAPSSRSPPAVSVRRKRSVGSRRSSGGGSNHQRTEHQQQQQQQQQHQLAAPETPAFLTPEARTSKKSLGTGGLGLLGASGGTIRTADMTPSPLPSLPDVSPVPSAAPLTAPTPGPARPHEQQQQHEQSRGGFFHDGGHMPNYRGGDVDGGNVGLGHRDAAVSPLHPHRRSRVLFQEHDHIEEDLDTSDENIQQHHNHYPKQQHQHHLGGRHHDDRDDGFGDCDSSARVGRRSRSLPTIDHLERTHPSLESISSSGGGAGGSSPPPHEQQQHHHAGMPQDSSRCGRYSTGGRSSPSSHRRRSHSRQSQQQQQQHFASSRASLPGGSNGAFVNGGARQRGSQSRSDQRRPQRGHIHQQQQGQYGFEQHHYNNESMISIDDTHPLTSSSSAERSSSSNESSPERGYPRPLVPHPGNLAHALSPSSVPSAPFEPHQHFNHQQQQDPLEQQEYDVSSPSKDKYDKYSKHQQPFSFGTSAPVPLVQPSLGVASPWDRGQTTTHHIGPVTPSIMSSRPLSPDASTLGIATPRYGSSHSSLYSSAYPNLHRIRIRFRALLSSGLLLASVMFMLILAANYGSITSLDFGHSTPDRAAVVSLSEPQQDYDYKPVPVGTASVGGGIGLGVHEGAIEQGAAIRRGAFGLRVAARNDAPKQPEKKDDDKAEEPTMDKVDAEEKTKDAAAATTVGAAVLASVAEDQSNKEKKRKRGFPKLDSEFYASKNRHPIMHGGYPRLLNINHKVMDEPPPPSRDVELYPAEFSDNTQYYPVIDSEDDVRAARMEMRKPYEDEECEPMADWQTTYNPSCNGIHELDVENGHNEKEGKDLQLFGTKGFWRNAWKLDLPSHNQMSEDDPADIFVLKTLKYEHNFEDNFEEHDRVDAIAMERLTSSPHVINIYGFCGHSVITEYADGPRIGTLADKSKKIPLKRLEIARDIASGLADVHGIDGDDQPSFVHLDINPANVVAVGKTLKLNDFNIGIILKKNKKTGKTCGFPAQYPNPQWRSPEESREQDDLTEKVDIFSLGHIFFRLICGHEPWNKLEPGGRPEKDQVLKKVKKGTLPFIPDEIMSTKDREIQIIRDAMLKCYTADPEERPSARSIANELDSAFKKLSAGAEAKANGTAASTKAKTTSAKAVKEKKPSVSAETVKATTTDKNTKARTLKDKTTVKKETASKKTAREKKAKTKPDTKKL